MIWFSTWRASARLAEMLEAADACGSATSRSAVRREKARSNGRVARAPAARAWPRLKHMGKDAIRRVRRQPSYSKCLRIGWSGVRLCHNAGDIARKVTSGNEVEA